jgi:pimeloyl-ACP methyl ester carboxylesterase
MLRREHGVGDASSSRWSGSTPKDPSATRPRRAACAARDPDPFGLAGSTAGARQRAAIRTSGDRRRELAGVTAPTLVIHGDRDVLIRPVGGRATAAAIPAARLVRYPGMGHDLPRALWSTIADEIAHTAGVAPTNSAPRRAWQTKKSMASDRATLPERPPERGIHAG